MSSVAVREVSTDTQTLGRIQMLGAEREKRADKECDVRRVAQKWCQEWERLAASAWNDEKQVVVGQIVAQRNFRLPATEFHACEMLDLTREQRQSMRTREARRIRFARLVRDDRSVTIVWMRRDRSACSSFRPRCSRYSMRVSANALRASLVATFTH